MKKHCTVDTVDEISHAADLESKSGGGEHTNFDHEHDLTSGIEAYTGHDLALGDGPFGGLESSIKALNQDQDQVIIKMKYGLKMQSSVNQTGAIDGFCRPDKYGLCGPGKDGHCGPGKDGYCRLDKDGHFGPDKDGHFGPDKDGHFGPGKDGFYMPDKRIFRA